MSYWSVYSEDIRVQNLKETEIKCTKCNMDSSYTSNALQEFHLTLNIVIQAERFLGYKAGALKLQETPFSEVNSRDTY